MNGQLHFTQKLLPSFQKDRSVSAIPTQALETLHSIPLRFVVPIS